MDNQEQEQKKKKSLFKKLLLPCSIGCGCLVFFILFLVLFVLGISTTVITVNKYINSKGCDDNGIPIYDDASLWIGKSYVIYQNVSTSSEITTLLANGYAYVKQSDNKNFALYYFDSDGRSGNVLYEKSNGNSPVAKAENMSGLKKIVKSNVLKKQKGNEIIETLSPPAEEKTIITYFKNEQKKSILDDIIKDIGDFFSGPDLYNGECTMIDDFHYNNYTLANVDYKDVDYSKYWNSDNYDKDSREAILYKMHLGEAGYAAFGKTGWAHCYTTSAYEALTGKMKISGLYINSTYNTIINESYTNETIKKWTNSEFNPLCLDGRILVALPIQVACAFQESMIQSAKSIYSNPANYGYVGENAGSIMNYGGLNSSQWLGAYVDLVLEDNNGSQFVVPLIIADVKGIHHNYANKYAAYDDNTIAHINRSFSDELISITKKAVLGYTAITGATTGGVESECITTEELLINPNNPSYIMRYRPKNVMNIERKHPNGQTATLKLNTATTTTVTYPTRTTKEANSIVYEGLGGGYFPIPYLPTEEEYEKDFKSKCNNMSYASFVEEYTTTISACIIEYVAGDKTTNAYSNKFLYMKGQNDSTNGCKIVKFRVYNYKYGDSLLPSKPFLSAKEKIKKEDLIVGHKITELAQ